MRTDVEANDRIVMKSMNRIVAGKTMVFFEELKKHKIRFNEENVISIVPDYIPIYVKFIASLGSKFNFADVSLESFPIDDVMLVFEKLIDETNEFGQNYFLKKELMELREENYGIKIKFTVAQRFIYDQLLKTIRFLGHNEDIIILQTDKGGKSIILSREIYYEKMDKFIEESIESGLYVKCDGTEFEVIRSSIEREYELLRLELNEFFKNDSRMKMENLCKPLSAEPYIISKIYGSLKSHKDNLPIRPIIAASDCLGKSLSEWMLRKLGKIAECFKKVKIHDANELFLLVADKQLPSSHRLVTWDYSSMFTNIPFTFAVSIIERYYFLINEWTCVPMKLFVDVLSFLVVKMSYFTYKENIYKQNRGLAMGNSLSQCLAEIVIGYVLCEAMKSVEERKITFLVKFVDDIGGAMDVDTIPIIENFLNNIIEDLRVVRTDEDEFKSLSYLNCKLIRREDNTISFAWWHKSYASRQLLNYHSNHPHTMKQNIIKEYIKNALSITTDDYIYKSLCEIEKVLKRSSYPEAYYLHYLSKSLKNLSKLQDLSSVGCIDNNFCPENELMLRWIGKTRMNFYNKRNSNVNITKYKKAKTTKNQNLFRKMKYIAIPFNENLFRRSEGLVRKYNLGIKLAPQPIQRNKKIVFTSVKDKMKFSSMKNCLIAMKCKHCDFKIWFKTTNLDVERTVKMKLNCNNSMIRSHMEENQGHKIPSSIYEIKRYSNLYDLNIAFKLISRVDRIC